MSETAGSQLIQRMRMARRVADALLPLEGNASMAAASTGDVLAGQHDSLPLHADFVITALDLMLQLSLLVGRSAEDLHNSAVLEAANSLLWTNPQSAACVLVADDEALTSRIVEWGDRVADGPQSTIASSISKQGPLREIISAYLNTINLQWPEPPTLIYTHELAFDEVAAQAADDALLKRQGTRRSPIPERAQARSSLNREDVRWATSIALSVANGTNVDLRAELDLNSAVTGERP